MPWRTIDGKRVGIKHSRESITIMQAARRARIQQPMSGKKQTDFQKKRMTGENSPVWKGDNIRYETLHQWVYRWKQKPDFCVICNKNKPTDAANISGKYFRNLDDWQWLCHSCHMRSHDIVEKGNARRDPKTGRYI